jgi:two-component system LytT family response regulator
MIAIAIDDEPIALDIVRNHAAGVSFLNIAGYFTNAFEGLDYIKHNRVDLILLDIKMPDISGLALLNGLADPPMVIFTTAYSEHAVKSFELDAVDYLLKPFSAERFLKSCNKAHELYQLRNNKPAAEPAYIFVKDGYEQVRVELDAILFIEAAGNYTKIYLDNNTSVSTRITVSDMLALLPDNNFKRTHRAYIVARNKITRFDRAQVYINEHIIPIGATYSDNLRDLTE